MSATETPEKPVPPARDDDTSSEEEEVEQVVQTHEEKEKSSDSKVEKKGKKKTKKKEETDDNSEADSKVSDKSSEKGSKVATPKKDGSKKIPKRKDPAPPPPEEESPELPEDLKCIVCKDQLQSPRLLPCLHPCCKKCLPRLARSELVVCNVCKTESDGGKNFSRIPVDYYRLSMVEGFVQADEGPVCAPCKDEDEDDDATMMCTECNMPLCELHTQLHQKQKSTKDHKLVPIDKVTKGDTSISDMRRKTVRCKKHTTQDLSLWCTKCRKVICRDCGLEEHNEHLKKPAEEVAKEVKRDVNGAQSKTAARIPEVKRSIKDVQAAIATVHENKGKVTDQVERFIEAMHTLIETRKNSLLAQVTQAAQEKDATLAKQQADLNRLLLYLQTSTAYVAEVLKEGSEVEILLEKDSLLHCMTSLGTTTWERTPLDNGHIEFFLGKKGEEKKGLEAQVWKTGGVHDGKTLRRGTPGEIVVKSSSKVDVRQPSSADKVPTNKTPTRPGAHGKMTAKEKKALLKKKKEEEKRKQKEAKKKGKGK